MATAFKAQSEEALDARKVSWEGGMLSVCVCVCLWIPVVCWSVAIGRFASWEKAEYYCGSSYCGIMFQTTSDTSCEEGFGWSFALAVLCLVFQVLGGAFAVARHCFGEWTLQEATGDDLIDTTTRVNVEHTLRQAGARGERAATLVPLVKNEARAAAMAAAASASVHEPYGPTAASNREDFSAVLRRQQEESYQADDWVLDSDSGLEWSDSLYLYRDPHTHHLNDPNSGLWYAPERREWYAGDEK